MQPVQHISSRSLDDLEAELISLSARINAAEYDFLVLIREFDLRQGWKPYLFNNCAEWLNMKCGICPGTAREKVRVARALFDLPLISAAFQGGDLSYSKARSLTRIARPENEEALLDYAVKATAQQVDDYCRRRRNVLKDESLADARRLYRARYLSRSVHGDGSMTISVELPRESGELVMKALEMALGAMESDGEACDACGEEDETLHERQADALVAVAKGYLNGGADRGSCTADHYQVVVHVDEEALRGAPDENSKSDLPIETVRRLCCDGAILPVTEDEKGNPLHVGRKHRVVQPAQKRALLARDKCCRYPGCTHEKWLDAQSLPRFSGITWNIGSMVVKPASTTWFCCVRSIIGCCTTVNSRSKPVRTATGSSDEVSWCACRQPIYARPPSSSRNCSM